MTQPITYDAEGRCTWCGSTGYYLEGCCCCTGEVTIEPCPCNRWRPVSCYPGEGTDALWLKGDSRWHTDHNDGHATHWQPLPDPPEVGT